MEFDWDQAKERTNHKKHGVSFTIAITAFDDPFALIAPDISHSTTEDREILIGQSDNGVLVVIFTIRHGTIYRLISARRATRKEKLLYESHKGIPI